MKKEVKQHFAYLTILVVVISIVLFYQHGQIERIEADYSLKVAELDTKIGKVQGKLTTQIHKLANRVDQNEFEVGKLDTSLEQKSKDIAELSGELVSVQIESKAKINELESSISKVKIANQDFSEIIDDVVKGVVSVQTDTSQGSGFIINNAGLIATNFHVIDGANAASIVTYDGRVHSVVLLGSNPSADIALLRINASDLHPLRFSDSDDAKVGEKVIAIGNPGGLQFSVSQGIISATKRFSAGNEYIQIDVPINPGNSGGPLISAQGRVVGMTTSKIEEFEGVGFALAGNYVQEVINELQG